MDMDYYNDDAYYGFITGSEIYEKYYTLTINDIEYKSLAENEENATEKRKKDETPKTGTVDLTPFFESYIKCKIKTHLFEVHFLFWYH